jgi:hypothetical protein
MNREALTQRQPSLQTLTDAASNIYQRAMPASALRATSRLPVHSVQQTASHGLGSTSPTFYEPIFHHDFSNFPVHHESQATDFDGDEG